jgi:CRISPR-associated protein Cas1
MTTLYIDRKNIRLDCDAEVLILYDGADRVGTVPITPLQRVIIRGGVTLDSSLLGKLGSHGIGIIVLSGRKAEPSLFLPRPHNDATRRIAQYRAATNPAACLRISRHIVRGKLAAQIRFLRERLEKRPDARYAITHALDGLAAMYDQAEAKARVAELRGLEGASANLYFSALAALAPPSLHFHGRNRRPPRDPLNALLSLGYTLLHAEAVLGAHTLGLDPYIGFYHAPAFGRESLASDLVEFLRPEVDAWVLAQFNKQTLRAEDFSTTREGCFLGKAGRERFYAQWDVLAENLRKGLERHGQDIIGMIEPDQDDTEEGDFQSVWNEDRATGEAVVEREAEAE